MSTCVRCHKESSFFSGFMTLKGFLCPVCREIDGLEKTLAKPLAACTESAHWYDALKDQPELLAPAARLAELSPEREPLLLALAELVVDGKYPEAPAFLSAPPLRLAAQTARFQGSGELRYVRAMLHDGNAESAAALLARHELTPNDDGLALLRELGAAGRRADALALALGVRGLKSRALCTLILALAEPADAGRITDWLATARFMTTEECAWFLAEARRDTALFPPEAWAELLAAARKQLGSVESLHLLVCLDERDRYAAQLTACGEPTAELLTVLERIAECDGYTESVIAYLEQHPPAPALMRRANALLDTLARHAPERVAELFITGGQWPKALALFARDGALTDAVAQHLRPRYARALGEGEQGALARLARSLTGLAAGKISDAVADLIAVAGMELAPVCRRTAHGLLALLTAAELEVALDLARRFAIISEQRKGHGYQPLRDAGDTERRARALPREANAAVVNLLDADPQPFPLLLWPDSIDEAGRSGIAAAAASADARLATIGGDAAAGETEAALRLPQVIKTFFAWLDAAAGSTPRSADGLRPLERSLLFGLLAQRLYSPVNPNADVPVMTGDKDLAIACALRAVAFMPAGVELTVLSRWGIFHKNVAGFLRHHGFLPEGMRPQRECWASWLRAAKFEPEARTLAVGTFLPLFDAVTPCTNAVLYQADEHDPTPQSASGIWKQ